MALPYGSGPKAKNEVETSLSRNCRTDEEVSTVPFTISILYPGSKLGLLLKYWFDELEMFFPCIDRKDFYVRLFALFGESRTYEDKSSHIPLRPDKLSLAALTCGMAAIATYMGGAASLHESLHGDDYYAGASMEWNQESRRLLAQIPSWREHPDLDILRLHLLEVVYLTVLENKGEMSMAMAVAVDIAYSLKINNERLWACRDAREREYLRLVWWTVYYMDRVAALKVGRPILIRQSNFAVESFSPASRRHYLDNGANLAPSDPTVEGVPAYLRWPLPSRLPDEWLGYLSFMVQWSEIVTSIWDDDFDVRASNRPTSLTVAKADVLLMKLQCSLPFNLLWDSSQLPSRIQSHKMDCTLRLRWVIFLVSDPKPCRNFSSNSG